MTHLEEIHREEILERARRRREMASRQVTVSVQSPAPALSINDSASKARARLRGAQKQQGRKRRGAGMSGLLDLFQPPVPKISGAARKITKLNISTQALRAETKSAAAQRMKALHADPQFKANSARAGAKNLAAWKAKQKAAA